jgi:uncharacterized repeat protein (TIGR01451 family)
MALLMAAVLAPGAQAFSQSFQSLAPSPVPLTAVAADPGTGLVYAQENDGEGFYRYDPRTNVWTELAPSPIDSENNGGATYLDGKIYTSYAENEAEIGVYDIGLNSWSTLPNPLGDGTGDITSGNGKLYMAVARKFVAYDPATNVTTPLAEPPALEVECSDGFERWGGLQFDGSTIYGHQGDGCRGFGVYNLGANSWAELPLVPEVEEEGAVLGSALDPVTNTYLTIGPYEGDTLFRYDIEGNAWTTALPPFAEAEPVDDGGMAYVSIPGIEGVYIIQGENGTEFLRYTEKNVTDLSPSMSASVAATRTGGEVTFSIQVKNNGPERASGVTLSDTLPGGTGLLSAGSSQGSCSGTSTVACAIGVLGSGASATVTVKVTAGFGIVSNTATVSSQATDTNSGNDGATAAVTVPACTVPKVRGVKVKGAKKALRKAQCAPGKVKHVFSRKVKKGRVVSSGKKKGKVLAVGTKVNLVVSKGTKPKAHHKSRSAS